MNTIHFIALGANLPGLDGASPLSVCARAITAIAARPYAGATARARFYSSAPIPAGDQPRYINTVIRLQADITPAALLADLQAIEAACGRVRSVPNAPRILDLDIIDSAGQVRAAPDPILPHPRAHLRAFVLLPLRDVAPGWVHPVLRQPISALIQGLPAQDIAPV